MRKLAIAVALASTGLATPALARDHSPYVGVEGGGMFVEDMDVDYDDGVISIRRTQSVDRTRLASMSMPSPATISE